MNAEQDLDRSEAASPYKLSEARKRGQVAKSADAVSALVLAAAVAWAHAQAWPLMLTELRLARGLLAGTGDNGGVLAPAQAVAAALATIDALLPLLAALTLAALIGNLAQTGPIFSLHPVTPDWQRVNPLQGMRRIFSKRLLFELLRMPLKVGVIATIVVLVLRRSAPSLQGLGALSALGQLNVIVAALIALALKVVLGLGLLAALDIGYTRHDYAQQQRMSRRELKDEHKHREGDPRIRARLRELRREWLKRSLSLRRTRQADVVIVNPTHLAVALRYEPGRTDAPSVTSKGAGSLALAMRRIAARHRITVVHSPLLARALFAQVGVDQHIPVSLYPEVARVMVWVLVRRGISPKAAS